MSPTEVRSLAQLKQSFWQNGRPESLLSNIAERRYSLDDIEKFNLFDWDNATYSDILPFEDLEYYLSDEGALWFVPIWFQFDYDETDPDIAADCVPHLMHDLLRDNGIAAPCRFRINNLSPGQYAVLLNALKIYYEVDVSAKVNLADRDSIHRFSKSYFDFVEEADVLRLPK